MPKITFLIKTAGITEIYYGNFAIYSIKLIVAKINYIILGSIRRVYGAW
jgi:hypothetical protein